MTRLSKLLERIVRPLSFLAVAIWWAGCGYVMSWAGHKPLRPDPATGRIFPFNDHGVLYVSARDLYFWHLTELATGTLVLLIAFCLSIGRQLTKNARVGPQ